MEAEKLTTNEVRGEELCCRRCGQYHNAGFFGMLFGAFAAIGSMALLIAIFSSIRRLFFG